MRKVLAVLFALALVMAMAVPAFALNSNSGYSYKTVDYHISTRDDDSIAWTFSPPSVFPATLDKAVPDRIDQYDIVMRDSDDAVDAAFVMKPTEASVYEGFDILKADASDYVGYSIDGLSGARMITFDFDPFIIQNDDKLMENMFWVEGTRWNVGYRAEGYGVVNGEFKQFSATYSAAYDTPGHRDNVYSALPLGLQVNINNSLHAHSDYLYFSRLSVQLFYIDENTSYDLRVTSVVDDSVGYNGDMANFLTNNGVKYGDTIIVEDISDVNFLDWVVNIASGFLELQIGPFTLGGVLGTIVGIGLLVVFIKYFKG